MTHELWEDPESTLNSLRIEGVSTNDWGWSLIRETCPFTSLWLADKSHQVAKISLKDAGKETRPLPISKQVYPVWGSLQLIASFVWVRGGARFCLLLRNVSSSQRCLSINNRIIIKWTNVLLDIPVVAMATSELPVQISNEPATPRRARFCLSWPQLSLQLSVWTLLLWARGHLSLSEKCGPPSRNSQVAWHCWLCNPTPAGHSRSFITESAEKWLILALSHH